MIYEWRTYVAMPGRMPDLHRRFRDITRGYFEQYGIHVVAFFEETIGANDRLQYLLRYEDLADRDRRWSAFQSDPGWIAARAETEKNGPLVARIENRILRLTDYSPAP